MRVIIFFDDAFDVREESVSLCWCKNPAFFKEVVNYPGLHLLLQCLDFRLLCVNRPLIRFLSGQEVDKFKLPGLDFSPLVVNKCVKAVAVGFKPVELVVIQTQ